MADNLADNRLTMGSEMSREIKAGGLAERLTHRIANPSNSSAKSTKIGALVIRTNRKQAVNVITRLFPTITTKHRPTPGLDGALPHGWRME